MRLPKAVALDDDVRSVTVVAVGRARVIAAVGESWDRWFDSPGVTPDLMAERDQPSMQEEKRFIGCGAMQWCETIKLSVYSVELCKLLTLFFLRGIMSRERGVDF